MVVETASIHIAIPCVSLNIAHLSDQIIALTARLDPIEKRQ